MQKEIIGYVVTDENDNPITLEGMGATYVFPDLKHAKFWRGAKRIRKAALRILDLRDRSDSKPGLKIQR